MGKIAGGLAIEFYYVFHTQTIQQVRQNKPSYRIDAINGDSEISGFNSVDIDQLQFQNLVNVDLIVVVFVSYLSNLVNFGIVKIGSSSHGQHFFSIFVAQKFTVLVEQFQCIPLLGIMAGGDDDTSAGTLFFYCYFCSGGGGKTNVDNIHANSAQRSADNAVDHRTGQTGITAYHNLVVFYPSIVSQPSGKCGGEFYYIKRSQIVVYFSANGTSYSRNGFY